MKLVLRDTSSQAEKVVKISVERFAFNKDFDSN